MPTSLVNLEITDTFTAWKNKINDIIAAINTIQTEGAPQLATARTIALSGAATGSASFDGSKNITIATTLANSGVTAGSYGLSANATPADGATFNVPYITVNAKGLVTGAKTCTVKLPTNDGTADKADKLTTARTVDGVKFDGSANIHHYGTCSTAAGTAAKTVTLNNFVLATGAIVCVRFTVTNTASSPTLNVNRTGAKAIRYRNAAISASYLAANRTYLFVYDGTYYQLIGDIDSQRSVASDTEVTAGTNNSKVITPLRLKTFMQTRTEWSSKSRTADVAANTEFTICSYVVGSKELNVYLNGLRCQRGIDFNEVGTAGETSTKIKFTEVLKKDICVVCVVFQGDNMMNAFDMFKRMQKLIVPDYSDYTELAKGKQVDCPFDGFLEGE